MQRKKIMIACCVGLTMAVAYLGFSPKEVAYSSDASSHRVVSFDGSFQSYASPEELYQNSDVIAEVKVKSQETVKVTETLANTLSKVDVKKVYKGDPKLKSLLVTETGGVVDFTNVKGNEGRSTGSAKQPGLVELVIEHSPVMKDQRSYILFLKQNPEPEWGYNVLGTVQGKLKVEDQTGILYSTVESEHVNDATGLFFLQKEFAGKTAKDFEKMIQKLNK